MTIFKFASGGDSAAEMSHSSTAAAASPDGASTRKVFERTRARTSSDNRDMIENFRDLRA